MFNSRRKNTIKPMIMPNKDFFHGGGLDFLRNYDWIEEYRKTKAIQAELRELVEDRKKTEALPVAKRDLLKLLKGFFSEYQAKRKEIIQDVFGSVQAGDKNPFFLSRCRSNFNGLSLQLSIDWSEIESAIKAMPNNGRSLSLKDRKVTISHLNLRISKLEADLEEIFPKSSYYRRMGAGPDARDALVEWWIKLQRQVDGPIGPTGFLLSLSNPKEQQAHKKLRISDFVNKDAKFRPHDPY